MTQEITDDFMKQMITTTKNYTVVILKAGENISMTGVEKIIWEHARRNFSLRQQGLLCIVCPIKDDSNVCGVGIFSSGIDETKSIMEDDPGVKAGVFIYELHPCRSFPGDSL